MKVSPTKVHVKVMIKNKLPSSKDVAKRKSGHFLTSDGSKPDKNKFKAVVGSFLPLMTMITYLAKFLLNVSEVTGPFKRLLDKNVNGIGVIHTRKR